MFAELVTRPMRDEITPFEHYRLLCTLLADTHTGLRVLVQIWASLHCLGLPPPQKHTLTQGIGCR